MSALLDQFIEEGRELFEVVESGLLVLERTPHDAETLNEVFRCAHTFKGSSGLFDLPELTQLTHACEDVLDSARAGDTVLTSTIIDGLNVAFDLVRGWLDDLADTGELGADAAQHGAAATHTLRSVHGSATATSVDVARTELDVEAGDVLWRLTYRPDPGCFFRGEDPLLLVRQIPDLIALDLAPRTPWPPIDELDEFECDLCFVALSSAGRDELEFLFRFVADEITITREHVGTTAPLQGRTQHGELIELLVVQRTVLGIPGRPDAANGRIRSAAAVVRRVLIAMGRESDGVADAEARSLAESSPAALQDWIDDLLTELDQSDTADQADGAVLAESASADTTTTTNVHGAQTRPLKVDQAKVDRLLELAGELVVSKNALPFLAREAEEAYGATVLAGQIKDQYTAMNRLAEELQHAVMDIRMLPVSVALQRFPRLVRDLARKLDKEVRLVIEGEHTQADKDVIELIGDPLLHLVRNSLDHGIETPVQRLAVGKPAEATLRLSATQEADSVLICVSDDGRGMDPAMLRHQAVTKGLLTPEQAGRLADRDALRLILLPGFSTADQISDVSGRGVGMDVVRSTIAHLGGEVAIESVIGSGSQVTIRLPLTMSVMTVMMVSAGGGRFGIPIDLIRETVKVPRGDVGSIQRNDTIALRSGLIPVIDLAEALGLEPADPDADLTVCVVRLDGHDVGLAVDRFHANVDVILKPLEGVMHGIPCYSGTALLGDGEVLLVLNTKEVVHRAPAHV